MALQKSVTSAQGVSANYYRLDNININADQTTVRFDVQLFLDAAARSSGKSPLEYHEYIVDGGDFTTYFATAVLDVVNQNPQERAYEWLKTQTTPVDFTTGTTDV